MHWWSRPNRPTWSSEASKWATPTPEATYPRVASGGPRTRASPTGRCRRPAYACVGPPRSKAYRLTCSLAGPHRRRRQIIPSQVVRYQPSVAYERPVIGRLPGVNRRCAFINQCSASNGDNGQRKRLTRRLGYNGRERRRDRRTADPSFGRERGVRHDSRAKHDRQGPVHPDRRTVSDSVETATPIDSLDQDSSPGGFTATGSATSTTFRRPTTGRSSTNSK